MSEGNADILVEVADEDLPKLEEIYEEHKEWAPHAYSTITNAIKWKTTRYGQYMKVMSPNSCWKDDGTFFVVTEYHSFDIFIFTLDETGKNVYEALAKTTRFNTDYSDRPLLLYSIHNKLYYPAVERALKERNAKISAEIPCYLYAISKEEALKFDTQCPSEVYIKKLEKIHANTLNEKWPHRYKNSEKYIEILIDINDSYGVFLKSTDELVSWALISMMGQISLVQTADDHRKKGYASLITKYHAKELAKKGHNTLGTVLVNNIISQKMFGKMGFKSLGICTFALFSFKSDA